MRVSNYKILLFIIFTSYTYLASDSLPLTTTNNHIAQAITYLNEITTGNIPATLQAPINSLKILLEAFILDAQKSWLYPDGDLASEITDISSSNNQKNLGSYSVSELITAANEVIQHLNDLAPRSTPAKPLSVKTLTSSLLVLCTTLSKIAGTSMLHAVANEYGVAICNTYNLLTKIATRYSMPGTTTASTDAYNFLTATNTVTFTDGIATYILNTGHTTTWRAGISTKLLNLCAAMMQNFITEYDFGQSGPYSIVKASNNILWASEYLSEHISLINDNGTLIRRSTLSGNADHLAADASGNIWTILEASKSLLKIAPDGTVTTYTLPNKVNGSDYALTYGPSNTIWYTNKDKNKIGKFNIATSAATEYTASLPGGIVAGSDGALYFTSCATNDNKIGRITPDGTITYFSSGLTANSLTNPDAAIICDPNGILWFLETSVNKIGKFDYAAATITEYTIPTAGANCRNGITYGPDGCIWFVETDVNKIGRLNPANDVFTEFTIPTDNAQPWSCCIADDGALWFTEQGTNKTARIELIK